MSNALRLYKRYPAYRESGVEWLGDVPAHWITRRLKLVAPTVDHRSDDSELPYVGLENIEPRTGRLLADGSSDDDDSEVEATASLFNPGDVLFGKLRPYLAKVVAATFRGRSSTELLVLRSRGDIAPAFLAYQLISEGFIAWINALTNGTKMPRANPEQVLNVPIALPPLPEQHAISAFLDRETARIDALVAKKERLIELLEERRTALITRAVTEGLVHNVPVRKSGAQGLGSVPAHWIVMALSRVTLSRCDGPFGSGLKSEHYSPVGVRVIRLQNIGWAEFLGEDEAYVDEAYAKKLGDHSVQAGDLLIAGLGDDAHPVGRACVAPAGIEPAMVKADCFRFRLNTRQVVPEFAAYQLSATAEVTAGTLSTGATRSCMNMNLTATARRPIAIPPVEEQRQIVEHVTVENGRYTVLMERVQNAIDHLLQLRASVISAAVTGKIDVREEMA